MLQELSEHLAIDLSHSQEILICQTLLIKLETWAFLKVKVRVEEPNIVNLAEGGCQVLYATRECQVELRVIDTCVVARPCLVHGGHDVVGFLRIH